MIYVYHSKKVDIYINKLFSVSYFYLIYINAYRFIVCPVKTFDLSTVIQSFKTFYLHCKITLQTN